MIVMAGREPPIPWVTRKPDGSLIISHWTKKLVVSRQFTLNTEPEHTHCVGNLVGDLITITVANGSAVYKIIEYVADCDWYKCKLEKCEIDIETDQIK